ncbi:PQQ-binding-like beta-propeller repeat protein [Pirellulimonas nuda]|uniref:PQQ-binding-like beta-propeller repeat protein n=1 Tax=Pirellulimonas nuda TaxID=2528009 RepID=UPI0018D2B72E|nr:PQQ-binding-like beta-propeller repeat protein [Pirellulimonas nuda]
MLLLLASFSASAGAADWPNWRGPEYDGMSQDTDLPETWNPRGGQGSNLLWKSEALAGRSTPVVFDGKLYTLCRDKPGTELEAEKVVCADAATGKVLWEHVFNVYLSDVPDTRVGWSSVVCDPATGRVYAQGVCGYFCCLDGKTGKPEWERSLHEEFGFLSTYGGRTNFPVVYKDTVITSAVVIGWGDTPQWGLMAKPAHRFMAFDKKTGELRWLAGTSLIPQDTTYSSPALVTLDGQDLLVFGSGDGKAWALQAGTGKQVWSYPLSRRGINTSPVVGPDGRVYIGQSEENVVGSTMGLMAALDGTKTGAMELGDELWLEPQAMVGKSGPILVDGRVYAVTDTGKLLVYDAQSGEEVARKTLGRAMRGSLVHADGMIFCCTNEGTWYTLKPTADGVDIAAKVRLPRDEVNGSPIVADGRIYLPTSEYLYCIGTDESIDANKGSAEVKKTAAAASPGEPAQVQVVPWETLLTPGQDQPFRARLFDAKGNFVREAKPSEVTFAVAAGPGSVSSDGLYQAPSDAGHECALVTCKIGELSGQGRVRITPPLPWSFDFEGVDDVPLSWIQGRVRYVIREAQEGDGTPGNHFIAKPMELPTKPGAPTTKLGTRSQMWMGSDQLSDYTVQADVKMKTGTGAEVDPSVAKPEFPAAANNSAQKLPAAGLINSRYILSLFGANDEVRLYSWCTHDKRTQAAVSMKFEPDTWYTMKVKAVPDADSGVARVFGKVWKRDEEEPAEWTLSIEDRAPNLQGSPGLFGDSKDAEFYVDNLSVTPN